jgi:hypothetical protein
LAIYFGYVSLTGSLAAQPQFNELRTLIRLLEEHRGAKGVYPVQSPGDVPVSQLRKALADSGVAFRTPMDFPDTDPKARYISVDGQSYGILFHFYEAGTFRQCIFEMDRFGSGGWGQPPPCPL